MKFEFSRQIFEESQTWSFIKIRPLGAELFHADPDAGTDRWTDITLTVAFRNFANAPKKSERTFPSHALRYM